MRWKRFLLLFVVLSSVAFAEEWKKDYTVGAKPQLKIDTNDAAIQVRAGGNQVSARVTVEGYKIGPNDVRITERQAGDTVEMNVRVPSTFCIGFCKRSVQIEVTVPAGASVDLHSGDGRITLAGTQGDARLSTSDGRIEVNDFTGSLQAKTNDGSLHLSGRFTGLDAQTNDGRIECEVESGSQISTRWFLRTGDGSIRIRLPKDLKAELAARTGDGHINLSFPLTMTGTTSEHRIRGTLNGGGPLLQIETGDGSIDIL